MLKSVFWNSLRCVLLLWGTAAGVARADEADDLTSALVAQAQSRSQAIAPEDQSRLTSFSVVLIDERTDNGGLLVAAVLQDQKRAKVIGAKKANVNGAVSSLVFPPGANRGLVLPTGEIVLPNRQPLGTAVHVDVPVSAADDNALLDAARDFFGQKR